MVSEQVEELQHRTRGIAGVYQIKMRNLRNGKIAEHRFRPGDEWKSSSETKEYHTCMLMATAWGVWTIIHRSVYIDKKYWHSVNFIKKEGHFSLPRRWRKRHHANLPLM